MSNSESSIEQITNPHHLNDTILKILDDSQLSCNEDDIQTCIFEEQFGKKKNIEDNENKAQSILKKPETKVSFGQIYTSNYQHYRPRPRPNFSASFLNSSRLNPEIQTTSFAIPNYRISQPLNLNELTSRGATIIPNYQQFPSTSSFQSNFHHDTTCFTRGSTSTKLPEQILNSTSIRENNKDMDYFNLSDSRMTNRAGTHNSINPIPYDSSFLFHNQNPFSIYNNSQQYYPQNLSANNLYQPIVNYFPKNSIVSQSAMAYENKTDNLGRNSIKKNKNPLINYELMSTEELKAYIPYLSKEQLGCRFLQDKIEKIPCYAETVVFPSIYLNILESINDQFGNYLIQKLLDYISLETLSKITTKVSFLNFEIDFK